MVPQAATDHTFPAFTAKLDPAEVHVAFGGGLGKFGSNCTVFNYKNTTLWIDYGIGFPDDTTPGMQKTLPDYNLTLGFKPDAIILTHAHEDHIGGIQHITQILPHDIDIYCSAFTKAMVEHRLRENASAHNKINFHVLTENSVHTIGDFEFHNFFMPHSIPQAFSVGLISRANQKKFYFTSDFKLQGAEPRFRQKDIEAFGPVDYLMIDSTGSLQNDLTTPENEVGANLENIIKEIPGRIFITTFSSQVERIRELVFTARKLGRPIGLQGYSIKTHLKAAFEAGEFDSLPQKMPDPSPKAKNAIWIVAGCQSEEGSSFYRLARNALGRFQLNKEDTLIYSGSMIPGNEENIYRALNEVAAKGVRVIGVSDFDMGFDQKRPRVHTSGHGKARDILQLMNWVKPYNVIPVHGDALHFHAFKIIVKELPNKPSLFVTYSGDIYKLSGTMEKVIDNPFQPALIENSEVHFDYSLYSRRCEIKNHGVLTAVIRREDSALLSLESVGVVSELFFQQKKEKLFDEIDNACRAAAALSAKQKVRKIRERIKGLAQHHFGKNPFIQLIEV